MTEYQKFAPMKENTQLTIHIPAEWEELFTMTMMENGAEGVQVDDPSIIKAHLEAGDWDASVFDGQEIQVGEVTLRTLIEDPSVAEECLEAVEQLAREYFVPIETETEVIPATDWQETWKQAFHPLVIGEKLWVTPYWDETPVPEDRIPVLIDPGMAFGTGDHATTSMAMSLMEQYLKPGSVLMDLGCGSGILGIAGMKLGAGKTLAIDIDDICEPAVKEHLKLNGIDETQFVYATGDILTDEKFQRKCRQEKAQVVVANITADVIWELAPIVGRFLTADGYFICSGILEEKSGDIARRLVNSGFIVVTMREKQGWVAFACAPAHE